MECLGPRNILGIIIIPLAFLVWWLSSKESTCPCRRCGFELWVGNIPWRRKWQPTPVFLLGQSYGQKELGELTFVGSQRAGHALATKQQQSIPLTFILPQ